jgi:hypothetical protein
MTAHPCGVRVSRTCLPVVAFISICPVAADTATQNAALELRSNGISETV